MDAVCKRILNKLISLGEESIYVCAWGEDFDNFCTAIAMPPENVRAAVRYLKEQGYLEYQMYNGLDGRQRSHGFFLSHKGLNWKYFQRQEIRKYIADKWVDCFVALISLASLGISIFSLWISLK